MCLQIFEINEISSDFNEISSDFNEIIEISSDFNEIIEISSTTDFNEIIEINGFLSDFKSRTGFWGVSDPSLSRG